MKKETIKKCNDRIRRCNKAIDQLRDAKNIEDAEDAWWAFLVAAKGLWVQLKKGASNNQKAMTWLGTKVKFRKSDPLLNYLFHARDSDEHTVEFSSKGLSGGLKISSGAPILTMQRQGDVIRLVGVSPEEGKSIEDYIDPNTGAIKGLQFFPITIRLLEATARDGTVYPSPKSHLGNTIDPNDAVQCAALALKWYEALISEAETFA